MTTEYVNMNVHDLQRKLIELGDENELLRLTLQTEMRLREEIEARNNDLHDKLMV